MLPTAPTPRLARIASPNYLQPRQVGVARLSLPTTPSLEEKERNQTARIAPVYDSVEGFEAPLVETAAREEKTEVAATSSTSSTPPEQLNRLTELMRAQLNRSSNRWTELQHRNLSQRRLGIPIVTVRF